MITERNAFIVNACSPTDCCSTGIFFDQQSAKAWVERESKNPEVYVIVPCTVTVRYGLIDQYGDIE